MPSRTVAHVSSLVLLLVVAQSVAALSTPYNTPITGDGTYYGESTGGNCALSPVPSMYAGMVPVAMNKQQYEGSAICGACLSVTGTGEGSGANPIKGTFAAFVSDQCPECKYGDIDLAKSGDGRWKVTWEVVPCPGAPMPDIAFEFEGSNSYYYKLQPRQMRSPATRVTVAGVEAMRTSDNHFVAQNGAGFPSTVEVQVWTVLGDHYVSSVTGYSGVVKGSSGPVGGSSAPSPAPASTTTTEAPATTVAVATTAKSPVRVTTTRKVKGTSSATEELATTAAAVTTAKSPVSATNTRKVNGTFTMTRTVPTSTTYKMPMEQSTTTAKAIHPSTAELKTGTAMTTTGPTEMAATPTSPVETPAVAATSGPYETTTAPTEARSPEGTKLPATEPTRTAAEKPRGSKQRGGRRSRHRRPQSSQQPAESLGYLPVSPKMAEVDSWGPPSASGDVNRAGVFPWAQAGGYGGSERYWW